MLRDPVERAISSYWFKNSHLLQHGRDKGSSKDFIANAMVEISSRRVYDKCMSSYFDHQEQATVRNRYSTAGTTKRTTQSHLIHSKTGISKTFSLRAKMPFKDSSHLLYRALRACFGAQLRSAKLGLRHLDKGIYVDQLERWWSNFPRENFHIMFLRDWERNSTAEFEKLLMFFYAPSHVEIDSRDRGRGGNDTDLPSYPHGKVFTAGGGLISSTAPNREDLRTRLQVDPPVSHMLASGYRRLSKPNNNSLIDPIPSFFVDTLKDFYAPYNEQLEALLERKPNFS
jgi:hypothetical protein